MISLGQVLVTALIIIFTWLFNKIKEIYTQLNKINNKLPDVDVLEKIIPLSNEIGWTVRSVRNGVPLWKYKATFTFAPRNLYGCRALLQGKPETILSELLDTKIFNTIFSQFPSLKKEDITEKNTTPNKDILTLSNINTDLSLTSILTSHHKSFTLERCWSKKDNKAWLYMCPRSTLLSNQYGYWIFFFIQELNYDNSCLLHILSTYPSTTSSSYISDHLSSCLVLCREHMDSLYLLKLKGNSPSKSSEVLRKLVSPDVPKPKENEKVEKEVKRNQVYGTIEEPAVITRVASVDQIHPTEKIVKSLNVGEEKNIIPPVENQSKFSYDEELVPYDEKLMEAFEKMLLIYQANESTPGWESLGKKDGVTIFKRDGDEISSSGTYKGTTQVQVPLPYLLHYCHTLEYRNEFDTLFEVGYDIIAFKDGVTKINNLLYQNVWPTTGRDFCSVTAIRHLRDNLFASVVTATIHEDCPERSNKVRGEVIIAGYVFKELSTDPPLVELTYVTRADLKGSIPQRIKNRVNAEQPLLAGRIRKHCERRYELRDPDTDVLDIYEKIRSVPSIFESQPTSEGKINESESNVINEPQRNVSTEKATATEVTIAYNNGIDGIKASSPEATRRINGIPEETNFILDSGFDLKENHYSTGVEERLVLPSRRLTNEDSLMGDSESVGDISQFTEDQTQISVSDQILDLPRDAYGKIDYVTLGNQAAAQLEQEFIIAKDVSEGTSNVYENDTDNWIYQSTTKGVEILRKVHSNSKFHSFLARGIIKALPVTVWEAIKNPTTRFVYDNMLKKTTVVKEISDRHRILHMRHETTACFVKQARDFCILTVERVEQQRYTLVATSVDLPECPPVRDCVRGRILSSGWIVEPTLRNGRSCSSVTYITQVDFGGRLPTRIINFIAKRQPLSLAYLREFLESSEF